MRKVHDGSFVRRERTHASVVAVIIALEVVIVVVVIIAAVDDSSIEKKRLVKPFPLSAESLLHKKIHRLNTKTSSSCLRLGRNVPPPRLNSPERLPLRLSRRPPVVVVRALATEEEEEEEEALL